MSTFDARFLRRCECLHTLARGTWGRRFLGRRAERRLAGGTEVTGHCDYTSGHDFRYVDWNICARHDELLSRQFQGNEDQYVYLLLDTSRSMGVGQGGKFAAARRLVAALAYLAVANLDRVAVATFAESLSAWSPPVRGPEHLPAILEFVGRTDPTGTATDLCRSIDGFLDRRERPGLVVIVSDFFDRQGFEPAVDSLRLRGDEPYLLQLFDPEEARPTKRGRARLTDVESGRVMRTAVDAADLANYRVVFERFRDAIRRYGLRYSVGVTQTATDVPFELCLERMMRAARCRIVAG